MMNNTNMMVNKMNEMGTKLNEVERIVTHSGVFHSDEVACVSLIELALNKELEVLRTRDSKEKIETIENDLVVDVWGGEFDHHTEEKFDDNGHKLSSIGLLYNSYKKEFQESFGIKNSKFMKPLEEVIKLIDNMDNGMESEDILSFYSVIRSFNNSNIAQNDANFRKAVDFMKQYIKNVIEACKLEDTRQNIWEQKEVIGKVVKLKGFVPNWEQRAKEENLNIEFACTFESWAKQYSIQRTRNSQFNLKEIEDLMEGVKFVHPAGFLAKIEEGSENENIEIINDLI